MPKFTIQTPSGQTVSVDGNSAFDAMGSLLGSSGPDVSQLGSFGRGALSMLPLGNQAYAGVASLGQNEPYNQERQELSQEQAQDKEVNPGVTLAGKAAGVIAPIALTAGLAAPETLAGSLGQSALIGGSFGAGNAVDTLASGGSGAKAVGDVALGAGLGLAGGAAGEGLGALAGKAGDALADTSIGQRFESQNISKALGLRPISLSTIARKEGTTPQAAAQDLWENIKSIPGLPDNFVSPTSSINDKVAALEGLKNSAGENIGVTRNLGGQATAGNFPEGDQAMKDLVAAADGFKGIPDGSADNMKKIAANIQAAKGANSLDFNTLSQIRSAVGSQVQAEVPGASPIYRILSKNLDDALDRVSPTAGIDKAAFQAAKKTYATTSKVLPLMQRGAGREATGAGGGLEQLAGGLGVATGHPAAALPAIAHGMQKLIAPEALPNIMLGGIGGAGKAVANSLPNAGAQVAASAEPGLAERQKIVNDFVQSQRSPAAAKQASENASQMREHPSNQPTKMADGGLVSNDPNAMGNLPGLQRVANQKAGIPDTALARTAAPDQPADMPWQEQLKAYILKNRGDNSDAK